jgi:hypothetical protein
MSYNLRTHSNTQLDAQLRELGAATFGSTERKRQRLQRFLRARDERIAQAYWSECRLAEATYQEQQRVQERIDQRIAELRDSETGEPPLKRRRIESCPSPDSAPAPAPVRRPALPALPGTEPRMTRSMTKTHHPRAQLLARNRSAFQRPAAQNAMDRIRSVIAEFLA